MKASWPDWRATDLIELPGGHRVRVYSHVRPAIAQLLDVAADGPDSCEVSAGPFSGRLAV